MWKGAIENLEKRREKLIYGNSEKLRTQYKKGKRSARERIQMLFDENTFEELDDFVIDYKNEQEYIGGGVICGYGKICGKTVFGISQDFTIIGGTVGEKHAKKIKHIQELAISMKKPLVVINDSGGARINEGSVALAGYGEILHLHTVASGYIPQIAIVLGPCSGGACYSPGLCDFVFSVEQLRYMFLTGPTVVSEIIGENCTMEELGGVDVHSQKSGVIHFKYKSELECIENVRRLLSYLPENCEQTPEKRKFKYVKRNTDIKNIVPDNPRKIYDIKQVIRYVLDDNSFMEVQEEFAKNAVVGFGTIEGNCCGIVANQPDFLAGALDIDASDKIAHFIRICDSFSIPIITLVDVPAFFPGTAQEQKGIIRHGAKILYAFSEATIPKISIILRKAYGGAYIAMNSIHIGADVVYAWPIAEIAVMGAEAAAKIVLKDISEAKIKEYKNNYESQFLNPYEAASHGFITSVILPEETRDKLLRALETLTHKNQELYLKKKHGNMPV